MKTITIALSAAILLSACAPTRSKAKSTPQNEATEMKQSAAISTQDVIYSQNGLELKGYLAQPQQTENAPALLLIHEWWGLNQSIKDFADRYAKQGYIALAVDLYGGQSTQDRTKARELATGVRGNIEQALSNLKQGVNYLKSLKGVNQNRLASVGWCFGGGWSYQMAKNNLGVKASVIYYGNFNPKDDLQLMRASILGHFGENDTAIKVDDVKQFQATLKTLSGDHEIYIYPNAGHAFANIDNKKAYVKEAAEQAWVRTLDFLSKHL